MSHLGLSPWQRRRLRRQLAGARDARVYRRTLAVLEFDRGRPAAEVARLLGVTRQSVCHWAAAYARSRRPAVLADARRSGRPRIMAGGGDALLGALLAWPPQALGYPDVGWTVPLRRAALAAAGGRRPSGTTLRRSLRRLGYVWKRPRYVLAPDPELGEKNGGSAARSGPCRRAARSWRRTRPTCCCSRRCGPPGRGAADPRG
jgi:transposase